MIKIAQALDMDIMVYTRTSREDHDGIHYVSLDTLLKNSDYISLHCPLTNHMFVVCLFYIFFDWVVRTIEHNRRKSCFDAFVASVICTVV